MRIGITADCHLGVHRFRKMNGMNNAYSDANMHSFEQIKDYAIKNCDALLIAGDLFDSANPDVEAISNALSLSAIKTLAIAGNHEWSKRQSLNGLHPFEILNQKSKNFAGIWKQFEPYYLMESVKNGERCVNLIPYSDIQDALMNANSSVTSLLSIHAIPYGALNGDSYAKMTECRQFEDFLMKKFTINIPRILLMHGVVEESVNAESDGLHLPISVARMYDTVVSGHIHLPSYRKIKTSSKTIHFLTPGAPMPSNMAYSCEVNLSNTQTNPLKLPNFDALPPSIWILDVESKTEYNMGFDLTNHPLDTPKVYHLISNDIKETLSFLCESNCKNSLAYVKCNSKIADVDEILHFKALKNTLNLSIQFDNALDDEKSSMKSIEPFWNFVESNHPEWLDEFQRILNND